ncbi:type VII secretion-associated serine protease [Longispora fulva]|uniref:Type VII secretion-associated serine protease mycosin n=1 Tax=Longispora fulva TaxID=619741 RepID=A0A8J7H316_9ACTN|nr:type VII secretion-associated serine protease mycosin [Longispora fulva]MBG6140563.1 type VII secretion-associated serine protease mycosin [Longispora fulva]GIG57055.1 type VII secretion-associated serine protease [Longispora fulva]
MQLQRRLAWFLTSVVTAVALGPLPLAGPAAADDCAGPGEQIRQVPWSQQLLAPERAWQFSRGTGVTVAVLDSGVDATQPLLNGRVQAGGNVLAGKDPKGSVDCVGHGTQVAGIIAGQPTPDLAFHGVAPDVSILPIRVSEDPDTIGASNRSATPAQFASAITTAVSAHARVIDISGVLYTDDAAVRAAISAAVAQNIVVVAAAGNHGGPNDPNPTPYPAAYPGVLGVGAIDQAGNRWANSQHGTYVGLVAPGGAVPATQRGSGLVTVDGTSIAAAFVSGAAALVIARWPHLTGPEVIRRLEATASPAPGTAPSLEYGYGVVNPYAAVTEQLSTPVPAPVAMPALTVPPVPAGQAAHEAAWARSTRIAMILAGVALVGVLVTAGAAVVIPRGRRRGWRSGTAAPPPDNPIDLEPAPPVHLFDT